MSRDLYTFFRSSTSYRLRIALAFKRLDYTPHYVSLPKMQHRDPSYRALHPQGLVPLLIDGNGSFIQSMAIIEYLDEAYLEPPLAGCCPMLSLANSVSTAREVAFRARRNWHTAKPAQLDGDGDAVPPLHIPQPFLDGSYLRFEFVD